MKETYVKQSGRLERRGFSRPRIIISGIGTGGHYFPAIVVAQEFVRRNYPVLFLVRKGYNEEEVARLEGLKVHAIRARGFYGTAALHKALAMLSICCSVYVLNAITRRAVGVAFGGFGSLPLIVSCMLNRSPFYLFEPNRIPGRATRLFAKKARRVFLGLPLLREIGGRSVVTGVPIRAGFKQVVHRPPGSARRNPIILFVGGSQGARRLNHLAIEMQQLLPVHFRIVIVCGKRDYEWVSKKRDTRTQVIEFSLSLWEEFNRATVIVSRAGALAGYEIIASHKPVLFIPFPHAVDDHQYYNAEYFARIGNALVLREEDATAHRIVESILNLATGKMNAPALPCDAEKEIANVILKEIC